MLRRAFCALLLSPLLAFANPPELPGWKLQGTATMRFFGLKVYDTRLWVREQKIDAQNWAKSPLALELEYARSLSGREIAKRSLVEMRRQGEISPANADKWLAEMEAVFPDVKQGERISGVVAEPGSIQFFINGKPGRKVADAEFARLFIGIWLAPQTSEPALRSQLLDGDGGGR